MHVFRTDQLLREQVLCDKSLKSLPKRPAWFIQKNQGEHGLLAGLQQGQYLERFVKGSEPAWATDHGAAFLDEHQFASEEILERD